MNNENENATTRRLMASVLLGVGLSYGGTALLTGTFDMQTSFWIRLARWIAMAVITGLVYAVTGLFGMKRKG